MKEIFEINFNHLKHLSIYFNGFFFKMDFSLVLLTRRLAYQLCWHSGRSNVDTAENRNGLSWQYLQENSMRNPIRACRPYLDV